MKTYTRDELDALATNSGLVPVLSEDGDLLLVNGMLGEYKLWVMKNDRSLTPCLTGEVGGMPGAWENWVTAWHTANLSDYDNYVDVGANVGYYAFLAASAGLTAHAVEANPEYAMLLKRSAEENGLPVSVHEFAASAKRGKATLHVFKDFHGSSTTVAPVGDTDSHSLIEVKTNSLNSLAAKMKGKTLIKMDIEGAEEIAFGGASKLNEAIRPTYIMEYTPGSYSEKFLPALREYGTLHVVDFDGSEREPTDYDFGGSDWITLVVRPH